jgi:hypothetical protein
MLDVGRRQLTSIGFDGSLTVTKQSPIWITVVSGFARRQKSGCAASDTFGIQTMLLSSTLRFSRQLLRQQRLLRQ